MKVPQINEKTGMSQDYRNEYANIPVFIKEFGMDDAVKHFKKHPVKHYEERFPPKKYENVVNDKNKKRVAAINKVADKINAVFAKKNPSLEILTGLVDQAELLINNKMLSR